MDRIDKLINDLAHEVVISTLYSTNNPRTEIARAALRSEYDRLLARIAELDAIEAERAEFLRNAIGVPSLEAIAVRWKELTAKVAELEAAQKWISVDERLPKNYVDVDILWRYDGHDDLNYDVTRKLEDETMLITRDGDFDKRVMFWKYPIPRPVTP